MCVCQSVHTKLASILHRNSGTDLNRTERKKTRNTCFWCAKVMRGDFKLTEFLFETKLKKNAVI